MRGEGMSDACPHCGVVLDPPPKANRKCPECREAVVVRTRQGERRLLTAAGAARFDAEREREMADKAARRQAASIGVDDADWERVRAELEERRGQPPSGGDVFWSLANQAAMDAAERGDWQRAGQVYFTMGLHLRDEGRDFQHVRREALRCAVRVAAGEAALFGIERPVLRVYGVGGDDDRHLCRDADGQRFLPEQLLVEEPPVPHVYDDGRWCPCDVGLDREASESRDREPESPPGPDLASLPPPSGPPRSDLPPPSQP